MKKIQGVPLFQVASYTLSKTYFSFEPKNITVADWFKPRIIRIMKKYNKLYLISYVKNCKEFHCFRPYLPHWPTLFNNSKPNKFTFDNWFKPLDTCLCSSVSLIMVQLLLLCYSDLVHMLLRVLFLFLWINMYPLLQYTLDRLYYNYKLKLLCKRIELD